MSGGKILVGLRDVTSSEKIIKTKSLLKVDLDIDSVKVDNHSDDETTSRMLSHTEVASCSLEHLSLSDESREVAVYIAGFIAKKLRKRLGNCCKEHFPGNLVPENSDFSHLQILLREGLTILSISLVNYMCTAFTILDYLVDVITQFEWIRTKAERILCHFSSDNFEQGTYRRHESIG